NSSIDKHSMISSPSPVGSENERQQNALRCSYTHKHNDRRTSGLGYSPKYPTKAAEYCRTPRRFAHIDRIRHPEGLGVRQSSAAFYLRFRAAFASTSGLLRSRDSVKAFGRRVRI